MLHQPPGVLGKKHCRVWITLAKRGQVAGYIWVLMVYRDRVQPAAASQISDVGFDCPGIKLRSWVDTDAGPMPGAGKNSQVRIALQQRRRVSMADHPAPLRDR